MTKIEHNYILESGNFPNNPNLPVIHYINVFDFVGSNAEKTIEDIFLENLWVRTWVGTVYEFNHYHSNNHEVLGFAKGNALLLLGGDEGIVLSVKHGDAIVIPAGVSHRKLESSKDFKVIGGYSIDKERNMKYGKASEKAAVKKQIKNLPLPLTDPIYGTEGPLHVLWKN